MNFDREKCNVVHSIDFYRNMMRSIKYGHHIAEDTRSVEEILKEYHNSSITEKRKIELKETIIFKTFFLFPYIVKKRYSLPKEYFDDAMMNLLCNLLTAIEHYDPERGTLFTNYLIGYCRDAITQTFRASCVVSPGKARRALLNAVYDAAEGRPASADGSASGAVEVEKPQTEDDCSVDGGSPPERGDWDWSGENGGGLPAPGCDFRYPVPLDESRLYETETTDASGLAAADDAIHQVQLIEWLVEALSAEAGVLNEDEREVLIGHFGLFGHPRVPYRDIAEERKSRGKGAACSRISQIKARAILKLRHFFQKNGIEPA